MNTIDDRYLSPELVMNNRFISHHKPKWKVAILCFRDFVGCDIIIKTFNAKPIEGYKVFYGIDANETQRQVFEAESNGVNIGIITRLSWGGPQAAILVEELSHLGVKYIIGYGAAGSIDRDINKGDQVIGIKSLVTDGTSRSYVRDKQELFCDEELLNITMNEAIKLNIDIKHVTVANIDALYRETKELIQDYQSRGAQIVNLETSALFAASEICNVSSIWVGFISDSLVSDNWDNWDIDTTGLSEQSSLICRNTIERIISDML
ncbi:MAG: hypothetical protein K0Q73_1683 [Paenibacillus sp.]|jgi:uridine phosphorylase|nr:hypothetical protein [Paenibacillus sp.]